MANDIFKTTVNGLKKLLGVEKKLKGKEAPSEYQGLTQSDLQNWGKFIEEGNLEKLDEGTARQMMQILASMNKEIEAFLISHERTLETIDYEDKFKQALEYYIKRMNKQLELMEQDLRAKSESGTLTVEDIEKLNDLAIILGRQSKIANKYFEPKKGSPQEQLVNRLGVWQQAMNRLQSNYGFRPTPSI